MKKTMWFLSLIPLIITAVALQFLPDSVPMHYNMAGQIDRWGSKYENLIFPVLILAFTLFWHLLIHLYEKKAKNAASDKERAEAAANTKVIQVTAIGMALMFGAMQCFFLGTDYCTTAAGDTHAPVDISRLCCILSGILLIVISNFMPKTKKNRLLGIRTKWSMYNDVTWMKSNRFGAGALIIAGLLTIVTAIFTGSATAIILMTVYLLGATIASLIYSYQVYRAEL